MQAHKTVFAAAVALVAAVAVTGACQAQTPGTSPVYQLHLGENEVSIYEKFTAILQHTARIKSVLDFDADVIKVDPVQGHPDQVTVYALATGVTTVTIIDEFDQFTKVEVLVRGDIRHLESYLKRLYPNDAITVEEIKGAVLLSGWVTRPENINEIVAIAEQFYPNVLNHMRIGGVQQVMLKATVMEVNRSKIRQLGMNFGLIRDNGYLVSTPGPITPITGLTAAGGATPIVAYSGFQKSSVTFGFVNPNSVFQGFVDALRTEGLLKIHATPMVVTHNGQPAELLNGGEAPVIVPAGLGTTAIEFKPFGIIMTAVPHILGNGRLRLQVEPSVVERDFANAVTVNGITVPSFTVRKVSTQVEMNFGETLVIGGLISRREEGSTSKVPFFGELPWIGAAFGRKQYTEAETELVILVTPEYVAPMSPEQIPAGGPGKGTDTPTDHELFFHNLLEVPRVGSECDATFNCMECSQHGSCSRHPQGLMGSRFGGGSCVPGSACGPNGSCGAAGCGDGCTDGQQGTIYQPMMINPHMSQSDDGLQTPIPAASVRDKSIPAENVSTSEAEPTADSSDKVIRSPGRSGVTGLISPLLR
ncbi:MAG: hypothetical protein KDA81_05570 [Planctomycetaceae bacterium]|nr:hypothetical protein [Planctomycetaceae bacterium]